MSKMDEIIFMARQQHASDIHLGAGHPLLFRINGHLKKASIQPSERETEDAIYEILDGKKRREFDELHADIDVSHTTSDGSRQRVSVFHQQGRAAATVRLLHSDIPTGEELLLPEKLYELVQQPRGLILVTGPSGSGKSTVLASLIESVNETRDAHVITIENPVEYLYPRRTALIHQREVGRDVKSAAVAVNSALREDADVIMIGQLMDYETLAAALQAASGGHLVLCGIASSGVCEVLRRLVELSPPEARDSTRQALAECLTGVLSRRLMPSADGLTRVPATEFLLVREEEKRAIADADQELLRSRIAGGNADSYDMDSSLRRLVDEERITRETALSASDRPSALFGNEGGFTLVELVVASVILLLLSAVSLAGFLRWSSYAQQASGQEYAKEIFLTAQGSLTRAQANGVLADRLGSYADRRGVLTLHCEPGDYADYADGGLAEDSQEKLLFDLLSGEIYETGVLDERIRLRLLPQKARVLSVAYGEDAGEERGYYAVETE